MLRMLGPKAAFGESRSHPDAASSRRDKTTSNLRKGELAARKQQHYARYLVVCLTNAR